MPVYYLETSALFKAYRTEVGSPVVRELLNQAQEQDRFYTSFLTVLEIQPRFIDSWVLITSTRWPPSICSRDSERT